MPISDDDLETAYSEQDITDVATEDDVRVDQTATSEYMIHQYKDFVGTASNCTLTWEGQTTLAPTTSTVYLQVFNYGTEEWDTIDSDDSSNADTDFILTGEIADLTNYKDGSNIISCRVYQLNNT